MNQGDKKKILNNWRHYFTPGCPRTHRLKKNAIFLSKHSKIRHQLAKCLGSIMVKKFGDVKFNDAIIEYLILIEKEVENIGLIDSPSEFITEAVPCEDKTRRVDLVELKNNVRFEFECDHKVRKENSVTIYI